MMLINVGLIFARIPKNSKLMVSVALVQIGRRVKVMMVNLVDLILVSKGRYCSFPVHVEGVLAVPRLAQMENLAPQDHVAPDKEVQIPATVSTALIMRDPKTVEKHVVQIRAKQLRG